MAAVVTDLVELKAWIGRSDGDDDTALTLVIEMIDAAFAANMQRPTEEVVQTEIVPETYLHTRRVFLRAPPVSTFTSVKQSTEQDWAGATAMDTASYYVDLEAGIVSFRVELDPGLNVMELVYTGGMAATVTAMKLAFPDVFMAANIQAQHEWQRKDTPGSVMEQFGQGNMRFTGGLKLLDRVEELLSPHRRRRVG